MIVSHAGLYSRHRAAVVLGVLASCAASAQGGNDYGASITIDPEVICLGCTATVTVTMPTGCLAPDDPPICPEGGHQNCDGEWSSQLVIHGNAAFTSGEGCDNPDPLSYEQGGAVECQSYPPGRGHISDSGCTYPVFSCWTYDSGPYEQCFSGAPGEQITFTIVGMGISATPGLISFGGDRPVAGCGGCGYDSFCDETSFMVLDKLRPIEFDRTPLTPCGTVTAKLAGFETPLHFITWSLSAVNEDDMIAGLKVDYDSSTMAASHWCRILVTDPTLVKATSVRVTATAQGCGDLCECSVEAELPIEVGDDGIPSCGSGSCEEKFGGGPPPDLDSVNVRISLGKGKDGGSAGRLVLHEIEALPDLCAANRLKVQGSTDVKVVTTTVGTPPQWCRQVKCPEGLVQILATDPNGGDFSAEFYTNDVIGSPSSSGVYSPSGAAFRTWQFTDPTGDVLLAVNDGGSPPIKHEFTHIPGGGAEYGWVLVQKDSQDQQIRRISLLTSALQEDVDVYEVQDAGSLTVFKVARMYDRNLPWTITGRALIEESVHTEVGKPPLVTSYEYDNTVSFLRLKSVSYPDGSWVLHQYDATTGRKTMEVHSWKDVTLNEAKSNPYLAKAIVYDYVPDRYVHLDDGSMNSDAPRKITVTAGSASSFVEASYFAYYRDASTGERVEIVERQASGFDQPDPPPTDLMWTETRYYADTLTGVEAGRVHTITYPDDSVDTYAYERGTYASGQWSYLAEGPHVKTSVTHGTASSPSGVANRTTRDITVADFEQGRPLLRQSEVCVSPGNFAAVEWETYEYDSQLRLTTTHFSNGTQSTRTPETCCTLESETDQTGITHELTYDEFQRVKTNTKKGLDAGGADDIETEYGYDAMGRQTSATIEATDAQGTWALTTSEKYDNAGRVIESTDQAGLKTVTEYLTEPRRVRVTYPGPDGNESYKETEYFRDGRVKKITGTAVIPEFYDYGVGTDGQQWTKITRGTENSDDWSRTTVDALGRVVKEEKPGFDYDQDPVNNLIISAYAYCDANATANGFRCWKGKLASKASTAQPAQYFDYDELGELARTVQDVNQNGQLDGSGDDRITTSAHCYENSGDWWEVTTSGIYATAGVTTVTTTGITKKRLTGYSFGAGFVISSETISTDIHGNRTQTVASIDRSTKQVMTTITPLDGSTLDAEESLSLNGLVQYTESREGITTTYGYDGLERRKTVLETPLTSATTTSYDPTTGRVLSVTDPAGYVTTYGYDEDTGRFHSITRSADPTDQVEYRDYTARGELWRVWGNATYPVQYQYDDYGRKWKMHTYRDVAGVVWTGSEWPSNLPEPGTPGDPSDATTWNYEEATGLLLSKQYADSTSVAYEYTLEGRIKKRTWARGVQTNYVYYDGTQGTLLTGELKDVWSTDMWTPQVTYTYTRAGLLHEAGGEYQTITHTFTYDSVLRLATEDLNVGNPSYNRTIQRTYDTTTPGAYGHLTGLQMSLDGQTPWEYQVGYAYDADTGRLNRVTGPGLAATYGASYNYVSESRLKDRTDFHSSAGGTLSQADFTYEFETTRQRDFLVAVTNTITTPAQTVSNYVYVNDDLGRRSAIENSGTAFAQTAFNQFGYNLRNEVDGSHRYSGSYTENPDPQTEITAERRAYAYDHIGNRQQFTEALLNPLYYCTTNVNQYKLTSTTLPDCDNDPATLTYDADGNLTSDGRYTYVWDGENRLISLYPQVPAEGDKQCDFYYDYMGRRMLSLVATYVNNAWQYEPMEWYIYDGWNVVMVVNVDDTSIIRKYTWGLDLSNSIHGAGGIGGLLAAEEPQTTGESKKYWYLYDGNGNVGQLLRYRTSPSETVTLAAHYEYDPYGNTLVVADVDSSGLANDNPIRFSTKWLIDQPGVAYDLYYYGYRYYLTWLGRWTSKDPIGERGGVHLLQYCQNTVPNAYDPLGLAEAIFSLQSNEYYDVGFSIDTAQMSSSEYSQTARGWALSKFVFFEWSSVQSFEAAEGWRQDADGCCTQMSGYRLFRALLRLKHRYDYTYTARVSVISPNTNITTAVSDISTVLGVSSIVLSGPLGAAVTIGSAAISTGATHWNDANGAYLKYEAHLDTRYSKQRVGIERIEFFPWLAWQETINLAFPNAIARGPCPRTGGAVGTIYVTQQDSSFAEYTKAMMQMGP